MKQPWTSKSTKRQSQNSIKGRRWKSEHTTVLPIIDNAADSLNRGGTVYSRASSNTGSELYSAYQKVTILQGRRWTFYSPVARMWIAKSVSPTEYDLGNQAKGRWWELWLVSSEQSSGLRWICHKVIVGSSIKESPSGMIRDFSATLTWSGRRHLLRKGDVLQRLRAPSPSQVRTTPLNAAMVTLLRLTIFHGVLAASASYQ